MYNISKDLGELNDISKVEKTKVKELDSTLMSYIAKHNADLIGQFSK